MDTKETLKLTKIVTDLFYKYQANPVIFNKFTQYIENLPELLENTNTTIIEREQRKNKLEYESETFIQKFLHNHKFFYHTSSELFFQYKDDKYYLIKEDDVQHTILRPNKKAESFLNQVKISKVKLNEMDDYLIIDLTKNVHSRIGSAKISNSLSGKSV